MLSGRLLRGELGHGGGHRRGHERGLGVPEVVDERQPAEEDVVREAAEQRADPQEQVVLAGRAGGARGGVEQGDGAHRREGELCRPRAKGCQPQRPSSASSSASAAGQFGVGRGVEGWASPLSAKVGMRSWTDGS